MSVFCSVDNGLQSWMPKVTTITQKILFNSAGEPSRASPFLYPHSIPPYNRHLIPPYACVPLFVPPSYPTLCVRPPFCILILSHLTINIIYNNRICNPGCFSILQVTSLLQNVSTFDRITVSAMEVVLTRQAFLPLDLHSKEVCTWGRARSSYTPSDFYGYI